VGIRESLKDGEELREEVEEGQNDIDGDAEGEGLSEAVSLEEEVKAGEGIWVTL